MLKSDAIEHYGGQQPLADALGIKQPSVSEWGKYVPELRAYQLEKITKGKLKAGEYPKNHEE